MNESNPLFFRFSNTMTLRKIIKSTTTYVINERLVRAPGINFIRYKGFFSLRPRDWIVRIITTQYSVLFGPVACTPVFMVSLCQRFRVRSPASPMCRKLTFQCILAVCGNVVVADFHNTCVFSFVVVFIQFQSKYLTTAQQTP